MRSRYLSLWGGAAAVGLIVGIGPGLWNRPTLAVPTTAGIAPQTLIQQEPDAEDREWAAGADDGAPVAPEAVPTTFSFCHTGAGINCVVDGDTIWIGRQKVRIADIDAPETHAYRCAEEKTLGDRATQRLIQLVNSGPVTMRPIDRDEDTYGRKLRIVMVSGTSVGPSLAKGWHGITKAAESLGVE